MAAWTEEYLLEGPASPGELVDSFIHTSFMVSALMIKFPDYLNMLTTEVEEPAFGPLR
jgi:hypothetical protein